MLPLFQESPLLVATHNSGKAREIRDMLLPLNIRIISAAEMNIPEPEETGDSFITNASLKACAALENSGLPSLADDSGLVIPALDGAPGIYSARWAGPEKNMNLAFERIQKELKEKHAPLDAPAYFVCVLALALPDSPEAITFEGRVNGRLCFPMRGEKGFGYDPCFIPAGYAQTFGEMEPQQKHSLSHRARAFEKMMEWFSSNS